MTTAAAETTTTTLHEESVKLIGLTFTGNITPIQWYSAIRKQNGKPDFVAIPILADIVYWYRPTEIRDETTGLVVGYRHKFKADKLQKSYQNYADMLGFSKNQVKQAFDNLVRLGLVKREFRDIKNPFNGTPINNVMFVEPVIDNVFALTGIVNDPSSIPLKKGGRVPPKSDPTNTKSNTQNISKEPPPPPPSVITKTKRPDPDPCSTTKEEEEVFLKWKDRFGFPCPAPDRIKAAYMLTLDETTTIKYPTRFWDKCDVPRDWKQASEKIPLVPLEPGMMIDVKGTRYVIDPALCVFTNDGCIPEMGIQRGIRKGTIIISA